MLTEIKNKIDFYLRSQLRIGRPLSPKQQMEIGDSQVAQEMNQFLSLFDWEQAFKPPTKDVVVADVGARTFNLARPLDLLCRSLKLDPEIHGIELDGYRRYRSLRTRADYGKFHAQTIANGYFHVMDFLDWTKPLDLVVLLNPFVTLFPLKAWGLPKKYFQPERLFKHAASLLEERQGLMLLSSPNEEEFRLALALANRFGLDAVESQEWKPGPQHIQRQPRFGCLLSF